MKKENERLLPGYLGGVGRLGPMPVREITVESGINLIVSKVSLNLTRWREVHG